MGKAFVDTGAQMVVICQKAIQEMGLISSNIIPVGMSINAANKMDHHFKQIRYRAFKQSVSLCCRRSQTKLPVTEDLPRPGNYQQGLSESRQLPRP